MHGFWPDFRSGGGTTFALAQEKPVAQRASNPHVSREAGDSGFRPCEARLSSYLGDMAFTSKQRHLLGGWHDLLDDIRTLCRSVAAMPDSCACCDGASHLRGSCRCPGVIHNSRLPACDDCEGLLAHVTPAMDALIVDTMRFFPVVNSLLQVHAPLLERSNGVRLERHIVALYRTFAHLTVAADEFRVGCRVSHLKALKRQATELSAEAQQLDGMLEGLEP